MTGFYARYDALMYRVMYPRNGIKLNNYVRPGSIMHCAPKNFHRDTSSGPIGLILYHLVDPYGPTKR